MLIHFIGIGGIGVSGLANIYLQKGEQVQGSDETASEITKQLQKNGAHIFIGHKAENITNNIDLVIYSEAVPEDNAELKQVKVLGIKCLSGAEALAEFAKDYFLIAVSGMHGKTTTACMIAKILVDAGLDPTYVIGTKDGWHLGKSHYLIIEADDYKAKLLNYYPDILVLTNIEEEHMDCFKDLNHILEVFTKYVGQVKKLIIANADDRNIKKVVDEINIQTKFYSQQNIKLTIPGKHNQLNAAAALEVARALKIDDKTALKSLAGYRGTWRRFEEKKIKIKNYKLKIISDYAHHPTELKATFQALKEKYGDKKIWVVFQPHQKQRTFYLFDSFVKVLRQAQFEKIILTDIYDVKGREDKHVNVSALSLAQKAGINYIKKEELESYLRQNIAGIDVLAIIGAGDIYKLVSELSTPCD